ncbi:MAG: hypothetical protein KGN34_07135 [Sphingomonadales bacterium]|nr:hypothetical protein [Sphingomonadales bacterium]
MGGPIGVMSPKFLLKAGLLLVSVRVDTHPVIATIDPSSPVTVVAPRLAERVDGVAHARGPARMRQVHGIGIDHAEISFRNVSVGDPPGGADMVIGADVLADMVIGFDFRRLRLNVLDHSANAGAGRGMIAVPFEPVAGKCLVLPGVDERGTAVTIGLAGDGAVAPDPAVRHRIGVGPMTVDAVEAGPSPCPGTVLSMGWAGFGGARVVLDMAHHRLWMTPAGRP